MSSDHSSAHVPQDGQRPAFSNEYAVTRERSSGLQRSRYSL
jgi:hypothetical protein